MAQRPSFGAIRRRSSRTGRRVAACLLVVLCGSFATVARAVPSAEIDTHLATIHTAYGMLLDVSDAAPTPAALLQAGEQPLLQRAAQSGVALTPPDLPSEREAAFSAYADLFRQAAAGLADADVRALAFAAIDAMTRSIGDDHTRFAPPPGNPSTRSAGMVLAAYGDQVFVRETAADGAAAAAGVQPGDVLVSINGADVPADLAATARLLAAQSGSFTLRVERPGAGERDFRITPGVASYPSWSSAVLPDGVGYMRLRGFVFPSSVLPSGRRLDQEIDATLASFEAQRVQDWVLDLRDNGGGSGLTGSALLGRFLPPGSPIDHEADATGRSAEDVVDGHQFTAQRPLALLVNEHSASESEVTASALREAGRALLVGKQTAGALANAVEWPVAEGAQIEIGFARVTTGIQQAQVDRVGVPVDIDVPDRTPQDYAAGRDPQLDAATAALNAGQAPEPPTPTSEGPDPEPALQRSFAPLARALATPDRSGGPIGAPLGSYPLTTTGELSEWSTATAYTAGTGGPRDAAAFAQEALARGWLGGEVQVFRASIAGIVLWSQWDLYASESGAHDALVTNDFPDQWQPASQPVSLGDDEDGVAYTGAWGDVGTVLVRWRRSNVVFTAEVQGPPGAAQFSTVDQFAQQIDGAWSGLHTDASAAAAMLTVPRVALAVLRSLWPQQRVAWVPVIPTACHSNGLSTRPVASLG